jgi:hypothetical protein
MKLKYPSRRNRRNFFSMPFRPAGARGARFSLCPDVVAFCGLPNRHLTKKLVSGAFNQ